MASKNNRGPFLPDIAAHQNVFGAIAGTKFGNKGPALNGSILQSLRIMDEQDAINSGKWYNLPSGLNQNLVERILYYRCSGAFFYMKSNDQFYFLPYVGKGLDVYGRFNDLTPLPFNGSSDDGKGKPWIDGLNFKIVKDIILPEDLELKDLTDSAVILNDYTIQMQQKPVPRCLLQEPLLQVMSEIIPFARTNLLNGTGIDGIKVQSSDESAAVAAASNALTSAAINGDRWIPIDGSVTMETLSRTAPTKIEDYFLTLQSLDNIRLSMHGISNGGIFEKKAHVLEAEQAMTAGTAGLVLQDKIYQRQHFCNVVNSIWGLGIWWEPSETAIEADMNGDGMVYDSQEDQGVQIEQGGQEDVSN